MESKKINQLATELSPALDDLTIIGDPTTGISRKITLSQMASLFTGTVEEYASLAAFPLVGTADTIYIALDTNVLYRWNGSAYVELSPNIVSSLEFNDANGFDGTITLVGSVATLTITTALTLGSLPFIGASGALTQDNNNLFYDDTNNRLGIGTNAPTTPLDVFGSGIIARINGTSTNNAFLGFASAGTNKWSVGNVQSDHRFRIFSEANSAELISVLQTGEFGIGIANPTTKLHLDGGATALIANLDANVSVAKSISFRSDNSNRINLEVSGTESGSNAGANFFIRRYSDAGALIDTPLTITRSTGLITLATALAGTSASFSSTATASAFIPSGASIPTNGMYLSAANTLDFATNSTNRLSISSTGAATFTGTTGDRLTLYNSGNNSVINGLKIDSDIYPGITFNARSSTGGGIIGGGKIVYNSVATGYGAASLGGAILLQADNAMQFSTGGDNVRLTIASGGNVIVGGTTAGTVLSTSITVNNATAANFAGFIPMTANTERGYFAGSSSGLEIGVAGSGTFIIYTGANERMRIASNGGVQSTPAVGSNAFIASVSGSSIAYLTSLASTSDFSGYWQVAGNFAGSISHPTNTSTNYNTTSDYRLKENIKPLTDGLEAILKLKPVTGNYINDETKTNMPMFLAHEVEEVIPIAVTGQKDAMKINKETGIEEMDIQQLDAAKLIPHMVKAIQEQQAQIEELKALIN
jgi:hypothetical protein